jgi:adenylate cyclase
MDPILRWLLTKGRFAPDTSALLMGLARQLCDAGFDLLRANIQPRTLHPEVEFMIYVWRRQTAPTELAPEARVVDETIQHGEFGVVQAVTLAHGRLQSKAFLASPLYALYMGKPSVRALLVKDAPNYEYPILRDLASAGGTDYAAWPLRLSDGTVDAFFSVTTRKAAGFTDDDLARLEALVEPLAACVEVYLRGHIARSLLRTYLGRDPGEAVLAGHVTRGDVTRHEAAIWFSDMRGFTQVSSAIAPTDLVSWLNDYFDAVAKAIGEHGGEILKFIGDAILAVFPVTAERSRADACATAVRAALAANAELDALNATRAGQGLPELAHGIGLHVGEVQYGNIGARGRLDFTVIGQAVNLASRIESLGGKLGRRTLASKELATLSGAAFTQVGAFELKGIPGEQAVFGI